MRNSGHDTWLGHEKEALGFRAGLKSVGEEDDMYTFTYQKHKA